MRKHDCLLKIVFMILILLLSSSLYKSGILAAADNDAGDVIFDTVNNRIIPFEEFTRVLKSVRIVYVGETHTDVKHHDAELKVLKAFNNVKPLSVGMEMFDFTYNRVLGEWSSGLLDEKNFLERTHWYANWKFDFELYRPVLTYIKDNKIPLYGLNIPFHIPKKVAAGGLSNLLPEDKKLLPAEIDLGNREHREYLMKIFSMHKIKGVENFEYFYQSQCLWEDIMADSIAKNIGGKTMIVFIGNGHIIQKFGVPSRAYRRNKIPYKTVFLTAGTDNFDRSYADYIWVINSAR